MDGKHDESALLMLSAVPGVGPARIRSLIGKFQTPEAVFKASSADLKRVEGIDERLAEALRRAPSRLWADKQREKLKARGGRLVSYWDDDYPELLRKIYDPPVLLFIRGQIGLSDRKTLAIVGTRRPTGYGRMAAEHFAKACAREGVVVVSGLARGIDTVAHEAAIKSGGGTIGVMGSGLDVPYPPENHGLISRMFQEGCVVSEFPMGTEPAAGHFPRRNRIISGLCRGTVVVEAGEKSGALITAAMALEQGREVFAVPGSIKNRAARGPHRLIREGAKLIENIEDVFVEIPGWQTSAAKTVKQRVLLTDEERRVWAVMSQTDPKHVDDIARETGLNASECMSLLLTMELKDSVLQQNGMMFIRSDCDVDGFDREMPGV